MVVRARRYLGAAVAAAALGSIGAASLLINSEQKPTTGTNSALRMQGVNLASGGFAPGRIPGIYGKDYKYPDTRIAEPFLSVGMNTVRVPVRWERIQPSLMGSLEPTEMARLDRSIQGLSGFQTIILDIHNYGRYRGMVLDSPSRSGMLADLWSKLAQHYKNSPNVAFGIMNEPHGISARVWRSIVDQVVGAIRASGARNLVLVPGTRWTGGHTWLSGGSDSNAEAFRGFHDPGNNFVYEVHQYFDSNSSGTSPICAGRTVGSQRLMAVTKWLRQERATGFLAEFGAADNVTCIAALEDLMRYLAANADVWTGWTYWAAGDWWGSYAYSIQPRPGQPRPQLEVLTRYLTAH